jgi:shikimate kinase
MNIVLIGYRGTGKSVVGAIVARRLGMRYIGMDAAIVESAGMPIPEIVGNLGWPGFRDLESAQVRKFSVQDNIVIDTGGGVIERKENVEELQKNAMIFWMKARVDTIVSRIHGDSQRPSLTPGKSFTEEVSEVLERRTPLYRSAAHHEIETDDLTPEQIAERIIGFWWER